jgi:cytochrome P450
VKICIQAYGNINLKIFLFSLEYANHPEIHKELLEEQERLLETKIGPYYSGEQINSLVKLDSLLRETLRMTTSIVFFEHKLLNSHYTFSSGHQVPKGEKINIFYLLF